MKVVCCSIAAMAATIAEVLDSLIDNADFEASSSVEKARAFITAATRYLVLMPASQSDKGSSLSMSVAEVRMLMDRATNFVNQSVVSASNPSVRFLTCAEGFRR